MPADLESAAAVCVHLPRSETTALGPQDRGPMQQSEPICVDSMKMNSRQTLLYPFWGLALLFTFGATATAEPGSDSPEKAMEQAIEHAPRNTPTPADPLERRVAEIGERTSNIHAGEAIRAKESIARQTQRKSELTALREQLNVALSLPPSSEERINQINQTWTSLRNLVRRLQDDRVQAIDALMLAKDDRAKTNHDAIAPHKSSQ